MVVAFSRAVFRSVYTEVLAASIYANLESGRGSWAAGLGLILTPPSSNLKISSGQLGWSYFRMTLPSYLCVCLCGGALSHEVALIWLILGTPWVWWSLDRCLHLPGYHLSFDEGIIKAPRTYLHQPTLSEHCRRLIWAHLIFISLDGFQVLLSSPFLPHTWCPGVPAHRCPCCCLF